MKVVGKLHNSTQIWKKTPSRSRALKSPPAYRNQIVSSRAGKFYNLSRIPFFSFHLIPPFSDMFQIKREIFNHCLVKIKMGNAEFVCSLGTAPRLVEPTWARVSIDFILVVVASCSIVEVELLFLIYANFYHHSFLLLCVILGLKIPIFWQFLYTKSMGSICKWK